MSKESQSCIQCHSEIGIQVAQIKEWEKSKHASAGVGCFECHKAEPGDPDLSDHFGINMATIVSPVDCARCHKQEYREFTDSHHAKAGEILGSTDNFLGEVVEGTGASILGCQACHGSIVKVNENGNLDHTTWPNMGIGRLNPDGSKGSCAACHSRHLFSLEVARSPDSCGKCHLGPDHPQKEIFEESKHGINYKANQAKMNLDSSDWILGKQYTQAPNCVTCHMGGTPFIERTHDVGTRISWTLRPVVSVPKPESAEKRKKMEQVCMTCHAPEWYTNYLQQFDSTVYLYNNIYAIPAQEIMNLLYEKKSISRTMFDDEIEWVFYELWHHEGRRARHGAAMMGADYVQWHGLYEVAKHFYLEFIPLARKQGADTYINALLNRPEYQWLKGIKPENLRQQETAFEEWQKKVRQ